MTAPSPGIIAAAMKNEYYDTEEAYLAALAAALRIEYEAIVANGFLLQLDCPDLALERHLSYNDRPLAISSALSSASSRRSTARSSTSRATGCGCMSAGAITRGRTIATCRSKTSCRSCEKANVGGFVLPFANPRHQHEWRVLQKFPLADDQIIVAGVIDDLTGFVEHPEVVADRLENVARAVGDPRRVMAGTDCGFDTSAGMGRVTEDVVWAKLKAMADGARIASQRLGLT